METSIRQGYSNSLKEQVINALNTFNYKIDEDAELFLSIISDLVESKIQIRKSTRRTQKFRVTGAFEAESIRRQMRILRGQGSAENSRLYRKLEQRLRDITKSKSINKEEDEAFEMFIKKLLANSQSGTITTQSIYLTMKGICPLWPFCK